MTRTLGDYNTLARENADLRDELSTLRANIAEEQERYARAIAEVRLASGLALEEVADEIYEDAHRVLERLKDRCANEGYLEGLRAARNSLEQLIVTEKHEIETSD